ncbi:MAG TPA: trypsin-like peptidase domain-containing protein [Nocardioidaceae bacterium]|nr:trypsin-like peptidase domain-containing protein [Nocardioidaceae bacterium]
MNHENHDQEPDDTQRIPSTGQSAEPATESTENVHRYGPPEQGQQRHAYGSGPGPSYGPPPYGGPQQHPGAFGFQGQQRHQSRPGGAFTAGLLVAALVVGGLGGLAGAAGFATVDYLNGDGTAAASSSSGGNSTVSDSQDTPAEPGSVEEVANSVLPSVVKINVRGAQGAGSGSGIIVSADGEILTNNHVVEVAAGGGSISVNFNDGTAAEAEVVGTDPVTDLAIIKAKDVSGLTPATIGKSANLDVGEQVVAVGSPFGLEATVTSGIVSAMNRPVSVGSQSQGASDTTYPAIQTDAAINPGNSGGPLVNMQGEVVGINSSIRTSSSMGEGGSIGLGFAIPIDKVLPIVEQLRNGETPTHARLGVTVTDATSQNGLLSGAGIENVNNGSAAAEAGLEHGDVVTKVNDDPITGAESLVATIRGYRPGDTVTLTVVRDGDEQTLKVTLDSDEGSASS